MTTTTTTRVGGPLLDTLHRSTKCHRRPVITPPISLSSSSSDAAVDTARQYLLIPSRHFVDVLSMENGRTLARLSVDDDGEKLEANTIGINLVCLTRIAALAQKSVDDDKGNGDDDDASSSSSSSSDEDEDEGNANADDIATTSNSSTTGEWIILAGCSDGTLREWSLLSAVLSSPTAGRKKKCGALASRPSYYSPLSNIVPRRIMHINITGGATAAGATDAGNKKSFGGITHLSSPPPNEDGATGIAFALVRVDNSISRLVRISIPPYQEEIGSDTTMADVNLSANGEDAAVVALGTIAAKRKGEASVRRAINVHSPPFDLLTSTRRVSGRGSSEEEDDGEEVSVIVVTKSGIAVYNDKLTASYKHGGAKPNDRLVYYPKTRHYTNVSSACVAPNGTDVAIGYSQGYIDIYVGLLDSARSYLAGGGQGDSMANVVIRSVHWHTHSVSSLTFLGKTAAAGANDAATTSDGGSASLNLLSGGEESVLLTWSLDRGFNRPVHTLPRLAKGGIVHIVSNAYVPSNVDIVVYCTDNTLRLINGYNYSTRWRIQGLADAPVDPSHSSLVVTPPPACPGTVLLHDPRTRLPILTNLPGAPGSVHWYDPSSQRVVGTLEVAPYNRISRRDSDDPAVPSPHITHLCLSESGDDMITIDTILTESSGSGGTRRVSALGGSGPEEKMTLFTTIKFWSWSKGVASGGSTKGKMKEGRLEMPYELISAMPSPHGLAGEVSSLAVTYDGTRACTLSHEEGAFRVWGKSRGYASDSSFSAEPRAPLWKCLYKITTPSGFSRAMPKFPTIPGQHVAFSSDGSVLAVCYGKHVTLWDHANSALLTSVKNTEDAIDVQFTKTGGDMLLLRGKSCVALEAPFGTNNRAYLGGSWSYSLTKQGDLAKLGDKVDVSHAVCIAARKEIAVALLEKATNQTSIVVLDELTGDHKTKDNGKPMFWRIPGKLRALCEVHRQDAAGEGTARLVALTERHEILALECDVDADDEEAPSEVAPAYDVRSKAESFRVGNSTSGAPTLAVGNKRRKKSTDVSFDTPNQEVIARFGRHGDSAASKSAPLPSADLPTLSGGFARDFIGGALRRS